MSAKRWRLVTRTSVADLERFTAGTWERELQDLLLAGFRAGRHMHIATGAKIVEDHDPGDEDRA